MTGVNDITVFRGTRQCQTSREEHSGGEVWRVLMIVQKGLWHR